MTSFSTVNLFIHSEIIYWSPVPGTLQDAKKYNKDKIYSVFSQELLFT